ncbi:VanW family protein [Bacillus alveayuensis]|uniref:VanW family protein n=1 Tax=Aeribacillus alveayuensis TaxID=279215 RepID=UPI0005CCB4F8|nr:VanW family protein [Bacillus alveayuensis]
MAKNFWLLLLTVTFIAGCSHLMETSEQTQTYLADEVITGKTKEELTQFLYTMTANWLKNTEIQFVYEEKKHTITNDVFTFLPRETLSNIAEEKKNHVFVKIDQEKVKKEISSFTNDAVATAIDYDALTNELTLLAEQNQTGTHTFLLQDYIKIDPNKQNETVSMSSMFIPSSFRSFIEDWISQHEVIEILENSLFSFETYMNDFQGDYSNEEWSFLATAIYKTILPTNFEILQRTTSRILPGYTILGYDVSVSPGKRNFVFQNVNSLPYKLSFAIEKDRLYVKLIGHPFIYQYDIEVDNVKYYEAEPIVYFTNQLEKGISVETKKGLAAVSADIYRILYTHDGSLVDRIRLTTDFYPGTPGEELRGTKEKASFTLENSQEEALQETEENKKNNQDNEIDQQASNNTQSTDGEISEENELTDEETNIPLK